MTVALFTTFPTYPLVNPLCVFPVLYTEKDFNRAACSPFVFEFLRYAFVKMRPPYFTFSHGSKTLFKVKWYFCAFFKLICVKPKSRLWFFWMSAYETSIALFLSLKTKLFFLLSKVLFPNII